LGVYIPIYPPSLRPCNELISGFSDPYCMLGIVSLASQVEAVDSDGDRSAVKTAVDRIPARFIKTTSVKENTLSPVWNEKFCL